jgi:hypothetical protein
MQKVKWVPAGTVPKQTLHIARETFHQLPAAPPRLGDNKSGVTRWFLVRNSLCAVRLCISNVAAAQAYERGFQPDQFPYIDRAFRIAIPAAQSSPDLMASSPAFMISTGR